MKINFVDVKAQNISIKEELDAAISDVIESAAFVYGPFVEAFEKEFAKYHGSRFCAAVNSGTAALHVALWALGVKAGDEVIVPGNTFIATAEAVSLTGATPVFVDCETQYFNLDPSKIESTITAKTKAVMAVHLYGQPAQLDRIKEITDRHGLFLIEDCAQSQLAKYSGQYVGTYGICGCFSFYPGKNLGAFGEGGAVIINDESLYNKVQILKDHGSREKYVHEFPGHNYRMEGLQGAVLNVKLKYLPKWTEVRRQKAVLYKKYLIDIPQLRLPEEHPDVYHVWHLFVVRVERRDELFQYLKDNQIFAGIHYPIPCHLQKAYEFLGYHKGQLPVTESNAARILSLPFYPELTEAQIIYIVNKIRNFYGISVV
jgi:dTDP-4-amino-4,6-dideoxygalactose transaminase